MSYQWDGLTTRQQQLIDSIADQEMRSLVIMRRIYDIAQSDPEKARRLLDGADISASQREQAESVISGKSRGY